MFVTLCVCALSLGAANAADAASIPLQPETLKTWTIVVAQDASPSEQYAAEEFRTLFQQALGVELPLSNDATRKSNAILIGPGASGLSTEKFGEEELHIGIQPDHIVITGGRPRGTLYGVYEFFETYFGGEYVTYDQTWFPQANTFKPLPIEDHDYNPPFSFRWSYYKENADHPAFATRLRVNTVATEERLGGKTPQNLIGHSFYKWINPDNYGKTHPEYLALVDGARAMQGAGGGPQPCVSDPEVIDIIANGVLAELDQHPEMRNIAVSQNDNGAYCRCPRCEEINNREGAPMAANLLLVNAVAERVEKTHPDVKIGTLAYWYTRKPPKTIRPRKNVQIQLCSIECCSLHPINDPNCPINHAFCEDLTGWKALSDEIWIWNYNTNFSYYDLPFPNLKSIGPNVKFFLDNHAKGVFMQSDGNGNTGEFCDLRNYVMAKCIWKPGQDSWTLAEKFCRMHYGNAADEIIAYQRWIHQISQDAGFHPDCGPTPERIGLTPEVSREALAYFARALDKAENDVIRARVEKASICAYKAVLLTSDAAWAYENGLLKRSMSEDFTQLLDRYIALCQKHNMNMHNEGTPLAAFIEKFKAQTATPAVQIQNDIWRVTIIPDHRGGIVDLFHKPTGRQLLHAMKTPDLEKGILETFAVAGPYRRTEQPSVSEATPTSLKLTKTLPDGSVEERTFVLAEDKQEQLRVGFKITQGGQTPQTWRFNSQTGLDPGTHTKDADIVSVYAQKQGWKLVNRGWIVDEGPDADLLQTATDGGFAFYNHEAKFGALITFIPEEVGQLYMFWHPERPQLNLDVRTPTVTLQPGQQLKLDYAVDFLFEPPH
jgi:hypothetical protein